MPSPASRPCIWIVDDKSVFCVVWNCSNCFYNPNSGKERHTSDHIKLLAFKLGHGHVMILIWNHKLSLLFSQPN